MGTFPVSPMQRRSLLQALAAAAGASVLGACETDPPRSQVPMSTSRPPSPASSPASAAPPSPSGRMPAVFLAHGSPLLVDDATWVGELHAWGRALPRPTAILVLSAHWVASPVRIGATETVPLYYDFYGFPQRYFDLKYAAPGAPAVAQRVRELLGKGLDDGPKRSDLALRTRWNSYH